MQMSNVAPSDTNKQNCKKLTTETTQILGYPGLVDVMLVGCHTVVSAICYDGEAPSKSGLESRSVARYRFVITENVY